MDWDAATFTGTISANSRLCAYVVLPSDVITRWQDPTLMATRAGMMWRNSQAISSGAVHLAAGLIKWSDNNDTAPTGTDCPGVITEADLDWIARYVVSIPEGVAGSQVWWPTPWFQDPVKAKRKLGQGAGILLAIQTIGTDSAATFAGDFRFLIKE